MRGAGECQCFYLMSVFTQPRSFFPLQRKMQTGDIFDFQFETGMQLNVVWAYSSDQIFVNEMDALQPEHTAYGAWRWIF